MLKREEATTKSEREVPPTPPKLGDGVLRRRPVLCDQRGVGYHLQSEVVLVTFEKKERGRDLEWEDDAERGEGWDPDPAARPVVELGGANEDDHGAGDLVVVLWAGSSRRKIVHCASVRVGNLGGNLELVEGGLPAVPGAVRPTLVVLLLERDVGDGAGLAPLCSGRVVGRFVGASSRLDLVGLVGAALLKLALAVDL